ALISESVAGWAREGIGLRRAHATSICAHAVTRLQLNAGLWREGGLDARNHRADAAPGTIPASVAWPNAASTLRLPRRRDRRRRPQRAHRGRVPRTGGTARDRARAPAPAGRRGRL